MVDTPATKCVQIQENLMDIKFDLVPTLLVLANASKFGKLNRRNIEDNSSSGKKIVVSDGSINLVEQSHGLKSDRLQERCIGDEDITLSK